mgnify:FL=1
MNKRTIKRALEPSYTQKFLVNNPFELHDIHINIFEVFIEENNLQDIVNCNSDDLYNYCMPIQRKKRGISEYQLEWLKMFRRHFYEAINTGIFIREFGRKQ